MRESLDNVVLVLQHISLHYGAFKALDDVSFNVKQGERLAIIGSNGAGKSSLFDVLSGFYKPSAGDIFFNGKSIKTCSQQERARLGVVRSFQQSRLFEDMTVLENLQCAAFAHQAHALQRYAFWQPLSRVRDVKEQAYAVMQKMGIEGSAQERVSTLSYASRRLVELGMVLATDAKVLLLDEPTAGLSQTEAQSFLSLIDVHAQDRTVLMVEHDMSTVMRMAHRVVLLQQGQVVACDTPQAVLKGYTC